MSEIEEKGSENIKEKNKSSNFWLKWLPISVSIFALLHTFISDCNQSSRFEKQDIKFDSLNYVVNSLQYKPILEFSKYPWIIKPKMLFDSVITPPPILIDTIGKRMIITKNITPDSIKKYLDFIQNSLDTFQTMFIHSFNILNRFVLKNTGDSKATIIAYAVTDTNTDLPILRDRLLDVVQEKDSFYKYNFFPRLFNNELQPEKETLVEIRNDLIHLDEKIMMHYLILYENEVGNLYDTYYWATFENIPVFFKPTYSVNEKTKTIQIVMEDATKDKFKCVETKPGYNIYYKSDADLIRKWLIKQSLNSDSVASKNH